MFTLNFTKRNAGETKEGFLSAVFYGPKQASQSILINAIDFTKLYREAGESSVISLEGEGLKLQAMIHDVDYSPVKNLPIHADFYIIEKGAKVHAHVPLNFVGTSEAVKSLGGTLVKVMHEINVEADPANLPHEIEVDISILANLDSVIHIKDISLPPSVSLYHTNVEDLVASISVQKEEDLSAPATVDLSAIEVEAKGKKEEAPAAE